MIPISLFSAPVCCFQRPASQALCSSLQVAVRTLLSRCRAPATSVQFRRLTTLSFRFPSVNSDHDATAILSVTEQGQLRSLRDVPSVIASLSLSSRLALHGKCALTQSQFHDVQGPPDASASFGAFQA